MIRKIAIAVMLVVLFFLALNIFGGSHLLVGNTVVVQCQDSDFKEMNDPLSGTVFSKDVYSTINYAVRGTTTGLHQHLKTFVTLKDTCLSDTKIKEFYCDVKHNIVTSTEGVCPPYSRCSAGACVSLRCEDKDGFNVLVNSKVSYTSALGSNELIATDYCESPTKLVEFVCPDQTIEWSNGVQNVYNYPHDLRRAVHVTCPEGTVCNDGACLKK